MRAKNDYKFTVLYICVVNMNPHLFSELLDYLDLSDLLKIVGSSNDVSYGVFDKLQEKRHGEMWLHLEQLTSKVEYDRRLQKKKSELEIKSEINNRAKVLARELNATEDSTTELLTFLYEDKCHPKFKKELKDTALIPTHSGNLQVPPPYLLQTMSLAIICDSRCKKIFMTNILAFSSLHTLYLGNVREITDLNIFSNLHTIYIDACKNVKDLDGLQNLYEVHLGALSINSVDILKYVHTVEIHDCIEVKDFSCLSYVHTLILSFPDRHLVPLLDYPGIDTWANYFWDYDLSMLMGVTNLIVQNESEGGVTIKLPRSKDVRIQILGKDRHKIDRKCNFLGRWNMIIFPENNDKYKDTSRIYQNGVDQYGRERLEPSL